MRYVLVCLRKNKICHLASTEIDLHWKCPHPLSWTKWWREVMQHLKLEKLRFTIHDSCDNLKPFMDYIRTKL